MKKNKKTTKAKMKPSQEFLLKKAAVEDIIAIKLGYRIELDYDVDLSKFEMNLERDIRT